jgi:hypothetical protein
MAIVFTSDTITVTDPVATMADIVNACTDGSATALGTGVYKITKSLYIGDSTNTCEFISTNEVITFTAPLLQVYKGSSLRLGTKLANGGTKDGSALIMTDPEPIYGFGFGAGPKGSRYTDNAGDFFCYGSTVKAYCFWAWFSGPNQRVEIINSNIKGFGRIEGSTSILNNVTFENSHSKYGIVSPKGSIAENIGVKVQDGGSPTEWAGTTNNHCIYANPRLAPVIRIIGGVYEGYDKLLYTEALQGAVNPYVEFIDSDIRDGYDCYTVDDGSSLYVKNTFNPILYDDAGNPVVGASITLKSVDDEVMYSGTSDANGEVYAELTVKRRFGASSNPVYDLNPYTIEGSATVNGTDITFSKVFTVYGPMKKIPYHISAGGSGGGDIDYTRIQSMLDATKDDICGCANTSKDEVLAEIATTHDDVRELLVSVGVEVNQNEQLIKDVGGGVKFLL